MHLPPHRKTSSDHKRRLYVATSFFLAVIAIGASGFYYLGDGLWNWSDCLYMTIITLSTVGYGEVLSQMDQVPGARAWTITLILLGSGTLLYFISNLTAIMIEGDLKGVLRRRRMQTKISKLKNHILVCGVGNTGVHVVRELLQVDYPFVAIDSDEQRILRIAETHGKEILYVVGDASEDFTLLEAGIERAKGIVAALHEDKDNLFVTITARALNPNARIVAKAVEASADAKLKRAGADAIVSPNFIGGMRMASEMIRPSVVEFMDRMLRDKEQNLRIEEFPITHQRPFAGKTLQHSNFLENTGALLMAIRQSDGQYLYNPGPEIIMEDGMNLIFITQAGNNHKIKKYLDSL